MRVVAALLVAMSPLVLSPPRSAQQRATPGDQLLDVLVWGAHMPIDPAVYPSPLKTELDQYLRRSNVYLSTRAAPDSLEMIKLHDVQVSYERRLVAVAAGINDAAAASLAVAYVDSLQLCYEWEGYHDCPERGSALCRSIPGDTSSRAVQRVPSSSIRAPVAVRR